jgi:putative acetyltransferase
VIRPEEPADRDAIREVNRAAFLRQDEGVLVDRLRASGNVLASLVAIADETLVGHVLFSRLVIETAAGHLAAAALAPLAVLPGYQRRGFGSALIAEGLRRCRANGESIVIVVGEPAYYSRFGFSAALAANLRSRYNGHAWMALELRPGALANVSGDVRYPKDFNAIS